LREPHLLDRRVVSDVQLDRLRFHASYGAEIDAYFLHPASPRAPALLYCHAHGARYDIGIDEFTEGRPALLRPYLQDLCDKGFAVLCLEMPTFGRRAEPQESPLSKALHWHGQTLFGQMLADLAAGVSFLENHPSIDPKRIGSLGISMGGTHAWWLAALDPRIAASASMCCFADLEILIETGAHDGHGPYMTVPGLLAHCSTGELAGLTAPRAQMHSVGIEDTFTPQTAFKKARTQLEDAYRTTPENLEFHVEKDGSHQETAEMRAAVLAFLSKHLL
jgi:pimeloyl-ACP methyl ester carboxylesterase